MTKVQFILYVSDQKRSAVFYTKALGKQPVLDVPGMTEFQLSSECKLGIMPETGIAKILKDSVPNPATGNGIPRSELYLYVENVETSFERALAAGAKSVSNPSLRDWGDFVAYVCDLDGHIIAFAKKQEN
jgi:uncharacterized glyoxalase superfamily protein PhnB